MDWIVVGTAVVGLTLLLFFGGIVAVATFCWAVSRWLARDGVGRVAGNVAFLPGAVGTTEHPARVATVREAAMRRAAPGRRAAA